MRRLFRCLLPLVLAACSSSPSSGPDATKQAPAKPADPAAPKSQPEAPKPDPAPKTEPDAPTPDPAPAVTVSPEVEAEVATGFNAFGVELYRALAATPGDQVISPASVAIALAMTHAGARGDTAKEMEAALCFSRPAPEVAAAVGSMLTRWNAPREGTELAVANRLFGEATVAYEAPYLALARSTFAAPLEPLDFKGAAEAARERINGWVEEKTHDRIQDLLPAGAVGPDTRLVLTNAIYFKSPWMHPFTEAMTKPAKFFAASGAHDVPTMQNTEHYSFTESAADGVQVIELPYADSGFAMTLVVPLAPDGLAKVEEGLTAARLAGWIGALQGERIALSLPKFRIAPATISLAETLGKLGIRKVFTGEADLTGIAPASEQLQLSDAFHKGFIAVDEKGTEAAAATAIGIRAGAAMPTAEPRAVKVDRPFLYVIRDTRSGLVMFMGRVVDPKTEG